MQKVKSKLNIRKLYKEFDEILNLLTAEEIKKWVNKEKIHKKNENNGVS